MAGGRIAAAGSGDAPPNPTVAAGSGEGSRNRVGPAPRLSRRRFLSVQVAGAREDRALGPALYAAWVDQYRSGRFVETARRVRVVDASDLRRVQSEFLRSLPPADAPGGFRTRIAAGLLHAEDIAHFGWGRSAHLRLLRDPVRALPRRWPPGVSALVRDEARAAWGDKGAADPRELFFRELVLTAARLRLARLDLAAASRILEQAEPRRDAALGWQLAAVWTVRARFVREAELWPQVRDLLRDGDSRRFAGAAAGRASLRLVARAMSDPDDRNLRLAVAALGMDRTRRAADRLREVGEDPAGPLRVPRLLLEAEVQRAGGHLQHATATLREAAGLAPDSQVVVAALAAALQAAGLREEAAALAADRLRGREPTRPWADFLMTWAGPEEPALDWLRGLVRG